MAVSLCASAACALSPRCSRLGLTSYLRAHSSLPGNDHPSYYSDTDASSHGGRSRASTISDSDIFDREPELYIPPPRLQQHASSRGTLNGQLHRNEGTVDLDEELEESAMRASLVDPLQPQYSVLSGSASGSDPNGRGKRRADLLEGEGDELESDVEEQYEAKRQKILEMHKYRRGNRGNKLKRKEGARWVRTKKLGPYTEARNDKEVRRQDSFLDIAALILTPFLSSG